ncbi:interleukin-21 receptor [Dicentrarchus labrax]|uniref:Fibronectin type-III domain-containing protein n=1 Tax=Dicentrarchus labrax TaxID=13489 RepID=A0A8C4DRQ4_DICLA|nr:interleukin-21 receptor [Dicentrarchus labrax]
MSGPLGVMDWCSPPRLKLKMMTLFLLTSTSIVCLHGNPVTGVDYNLHCVNDYLYTINCSLSIAPSGNTSDTNGFYWLNLTYYGEEFECKLTKINEDYFCSVEISSPFDDQDIYKISLCHKQNDGSKICDVLDDEYIPVEYIKPNAPCCLTVSHNSSQWHFIWQSTYEDSYYTGLGENLKYQLHYYKRRDKHNVILHEINTDSENYSVDDQKFVPGTEYTVRVRSSPNMAFYKGEWSHWSSEVHWKGEMNVHADRPSNTHVSGLGKVFIPLCVMVPLLLLLCYAPVLKWRQSTFIPTPAPYFHTLYSDCHGDFKSWVVTQENTAKMLKAEETLQIDTLSKCADIQEEKCQTQFPQQLMEGSTYSNIIDPGCDTSLLGIPYAVSTMVPLSTPGSSQPGSPAEGDSGCWICSHTSLERDPPFYCNEYCTLSAFQQSSPITAGNHGSLSTKSCSKGMIRVDATEA